jgi:hypothetical protein
MSACAGKAEALLWSHVSLGLRPEEERTTMSSQTAGSPEKAGARCAHPMSVAVLLNTRSATAWPMVAVEASRVGIIVIAGDP